MAATKRTPSKPKCFLSWEITDPEVVKQLQVAQEILHVSPEACKYLKKKFHMTLSVVFKDDIKDSEFALAMKEFQDHTGFEKFEPFKFNDSEVSLKGMGGFPEVIRNEVGEIRVDEFKKALLQPDKNVVFAKFDQESIKKLTALRARLWDHLKKHGFENPDSTRKFNAHVTLLDIPSGVAERVNEERFDGMKDHEFGKSTVAEFRLCEMRAEDSGDYPPADGFKGKEVFRVPEKLFQEAEPKRKIIYYYQ